MIYLGDKFIRFKENVLEQEQHNIYRQCYGLNRVVCFTYRTENCYNIEIFESTCRTAPCNCYSADSIGGEAFGSDFEKGKI